MQNSIRSTITKQMKDIRDSQTVTISFLRSYRIFTCVTSDRVQYAEIDDGPFLTSTLLPHLLHVGHNVKEVHDLTI